MADYELKREGDSLYIYGQWVMGGRNFVASKDHPQVRISTNNCDDRALPSLLRGLKGAKMVSSEVVPNYDRDPYGRRVQRGVINCSTWDLTEYFNN